MATEQKSDLISRKALIAEYDRVHIGPPGGARKLMGLIQRAPYIRCADTDRQYAVNWLLNEGVTVQQWISVKDRLPEKTEHDWVLVQLKLVPEDAYGVPCVAELRNGEWYDADGCLIGTDPEGGCVIATHWMPLPQPPKGE